MYLGYFVSSNFSRSSVKIIKVVKFGPKTAKVFTFWIKRTQGK